MRFETEKKRKGAQLGHLTSEETKQKIGLANRKPWHQYTVLADYAMILIDKKRAYFDVEDLPKINVCRWKVSHAGYLLNSDYGLFHRMILNCPNGKVIDHINGDKLDNCKSNLRITDRTVNGLNKHCRSNSSTGEFGVYKLNNSKNYMARVMVHRKSIYLGCFPTIEEAKKVRDEYVRKFQ